MQFVVDSSSIGRFTPMALRVRRTKALHNLLPMVRILERRFCFGCVITYWVFIGCSSILYLLHGR
ncbi:hypothetical protein L208DRAFT_1390270 [Tricholoma matsutake]|nr:hypothetical protein L208DRAFT_1390270 [Tricholoma matsutake 945]